MSHLSNFIDSFTCVVMCLKATLFIIFLAGRSVARRHRYLSSHKEKKHGRAYR